MGRHKFETQFKNKLDRRELEPSSDSWEQLAKKLDSEDKKTRPVFWWMGIAATVAGGILIFSLTFKSVSETEVVVETPSEKIIEEKQEDQPVEKQEIASEEVEKKIISEENTETLPKQKASDKPLNNAPAVATVDDKDEGIENDAISEVIKEELYSDKLEEVIAIIESKENGKEEVTDADVDALLAEAASEIARNEEKKFTSDNIDATALLWDVEMEIEQSFREKVFEVLKEGYLKAKTAVAARND